MDKRYKFLRGHAFAGLEDYWGSEEIEVKNKELIYVIKKKSSNKNSNSKPSFRKKLACFYEILTQGIYGGERNKRFSLKNDKGASFEIRPDLVFGESAWDAKAVAAGQFLKLSDDQMMRYALLQTKSPEISIIKTEIFRHGIKNLESRFIGKPLKDLVFQLTQKTKYLISMDLSVIFEYYRLAINEKNFKWRYDKGNSYTKVSSGTLNTFLAYPEESLGKMGINLKNIEIKKRKFPSGATMDNYEINPFPVLIIKDKNYPENWLEYFNKIIRDKEQVPEIFFNDLWGMEEVDYNEEDDYFKPTDEDPPF